LVASDNISPDEGAKLLKQVGENSKYVYLNTNFTEAKEAAKICKDYGLKPFEITHYDDFLSIQDFLRNMSAGSRKYFIGVTDYSVLNSSAQGNGEWKYSNGDDLKFSAWGPTEPNHALVCSSSFLQCHVIHI